MANVPSQSSKTAAVTGAASGIGRAFCMALAQRGYSLILIDRSSAAAAELAAKIAAEFNGVKAEVCAADLTDPQDLERASAALSQCGDLELLVNGAGFGTTGTFLETPYPAQKSMIELHIVASVALCRAALPGMVARNSGGIINIASVSAFVRFPESSIYAATKMFLVAFTECLEVDLNKLGATNVKVQALCPNNTRTAFNDTEAMRAYDRSRMPSFMWMTPETLVELSLGALERGSGTYIPWMRNRVYCFIFGNPLIVKMLFLLRKTGVTETIVGLFRKRPV